MNCALGANESVRLVELDRLWCRVNHSMQGKDFDCKSFFVTNFLTGIFTVEQKTGSPYKYLEARSWKVNDDWSSKVTWMLQRFNCPEETCSSPSNRSESPLQSSGSGLQARISRIVPWRSLIYSGEHVYLENH